MASKRRGGFGPPELRGTLDTLFRTTTGVVRDALERGAREGRARLDDVRAGRRRQDVLGELGELVLELIRRGEIDLTELPEARDLVRQLDELDHEPAEEPEPPRTVSRRRFDDRAAHAPPAARDDRGDGTVASGAAPRSTRPTSPGRPAPPEPAARHPEPASTRTTTRPIRDSWRPNLEDDVPTLAEVPAAKRTLPRDPLRKGGISFDDDDLDEYMHPDDVPPKGSPRDPGASGA